MCCGAQAEFEEISLKLSQTPCLTSLNASDIEFDVPFDAEETNYWGTVEFDISKTEISAKADGDNTVAINGSAGNTCEVSLNVGLNTIPITVTSREGLTRTVKVNIVRRQNPSLLYNERRRMQLHFSPEAFSINDPNGLIYDEYTGLYHLFFQCDYAFRGYQGGDICLNKEKDLWMRTSEHPEIEKYVGDDIVVTDGTSVLGADNKSAIANVMTAFDIVVKENRPHGDIYVAFVPDEEIGLLGAKKIDFSKFPVDFAYTVDCCELGEVVYETFNAGSATIRIKGVTAHPMSSKGVLVNPTLIATDFVQMMDRGSTPECTEGTEGFVWVNSIVSNPSQATVSIKIRDHNREKYEAKKELIASAVEYLKVRNPRARIELEVKDMYGNIADALTDDNRCAVDHLYRALEIAGVKANTIAMRGGTDGSFISTQGVITPNYFTGACNFHSYAEFLPLPSLHKSLEMTLELVRLTAGK